MAKEKVIELGRFSATLKTDYKRSKAMIVAALVEAAYVGEAIITQDTPVDTGDTRSRWRTIREESGASIVNDSPVAIYLEEGTRPHRPPLWPIVRWVMRVKQISGAGITSLNDVPPEVMAMARAVADKIEAEGTPARRMVQNNLVKLTAIAKRRVESKLKG